MYPGPVHTARHTLGVDFARSIRPMITLSIYVPLVWPTMVGVVLLAHTTVGFSSSPLGRAALRHLKKIKKKVSQARPEMTYLNGGINKYV
jgi:hypothetical protein